MNNFGFIRVAAAIPELKVADCGFNTKKIEQLVKQASDREVQVICFPELCITGYTCADLFNQRLLLELAETEITHLLTSTSDRNIIYIIGAPLRINGKLFNTALICQSGKIIGIVPKTYLPNENEFYELRWFSSAKDCSESSIAYAGQKEIPLGTNLLFGNETATFGIEICEDLWAPIPPSSIHSVSGAHIIFNLSASNELIGKNNYLHSLIKQQSARCLSGYVYASSGFGESTTDIVFTGNGLIYENGVALSESKRFLPEEQLIINEIDIERLQSDRQKQTSFTSICKKGSEYRKLNIDFPPVIYQSSLTRSVNPLPFVPPKTDYQEHCKEIFSIQIAGLAGRLRHTRSKTAIIGISGGLDSTLALLVTAKTFDLLNISRKNIIGITMPGFGTTGRTYNNALSLMESLGITIREISIVDACIQHFKDIGHDINIHDITFENAQARERTQILMDVANQMSGLVIGTGDLSELALGWATYAGDHISMYNVNASIPKTLVKYLVQWVAETQTDEKTSHILTDIVNTPVSPELLPADENGNIAQKTEDVVGPYELHDFFLYHMIRFGFTPSKILFLAQKAFGNTYEDTIILKWMEIFFRRFFSQQFKRSCMPDGPKVGSVSLSPRGDWRMPSDASSALWMKEIEELKS